MKDNIVSALRITLWAWLLWYATYFYIHHLNITVFVDINMVIIALIWLLWAFMIYLWIRPVYFKRIKIAQVMFWIFLILFAHIVLKDDPSKYIFIQDALKVLWVFMVIVGPTGFCIPEKVKKQVEESKIEIIEV